MASLIPWLNAVKNKQTDVALQGSGFTDGQTVTISEKGGGTGKWEGTVKDKDIYANATIAVVKVKCEVVPTLSFSKKSTGVLPASGLVDVDVTVDTTTETSEVVISEEA
jgi:hypothetical protein